MDVGRNSRSGCGVLVLLDGDEASKMIVFCLKRSCLPQVGLVFAMVEGWRDSHAKLDFLCGIAWYHWMC